MPTDPQPANWYLEISKAIVLTLLTITVTALIPMMTEFVKPRRSKIKNDIEIMNLLPEDSSDRATIQQSIHEQIDALYSGRKIKIYSWVHLILAAICLGVSLFFLSYYYLNGWSWWVVANIFLLIFGLGSTAVAFDPKQAKKKS